MSEANATHAPAESANPIVAAFFHARDVFAAFEAKVSGYDWSRPLLYVDTSPPESIALVLREIPSSQRRPVAFGAYVAAARYWDENSRSAFIGEFLEPLDGMERAILKEAESGSIPERKTPAITLEEFPSRIWRRALARNSASALVRAAWASLRAMHGLLVNLENPLCDGEAGPDGEFHYDVPSGDPPRVLDLVALSPNSRMQLRELAILWCHKILTSDDFVTLEGALDGFTAWIVRGDGELKLIEETKDMLERHRRNHSLFTSSQLERLGRLMFRLGHRALGRSCANAMRNHHLPHKFTADGELLLLEGGEADAYRAAHRATNWATEMCWHHLPVRSEVHSRIRKAVLRPDGDAEEWMRDPALACSGMSLPLWLADDVARVPALVDLFNRAEDCPWIFPSLWRVFVWHLALGGHYGELEEIHRIDPELAMGFHRYRGEEVALVHLLKEDETALEPMEEGNFSDASPS